MTHMSAFDSEIAVIGLSGRFPNSRNLEHWWQNLRDGVELVSFFTKEELIATGIDPTQLKDSNYVPAKAILDDIAGFDAPFFGFSPREAEITDPQQRIFLECSHEALETSGYAGERTQGRIGVYAGESVNTYFLGNLYSNRAAVEAVDGFQAMIGNDKDFLSTLVSYKLNLKGPSITVQTACSTSLVAVHLACQSLLNGECDLALAGGVSVKVPQKSGYVYREGSIMSPDGHCRAFDAKAQGTLDGNGVGIVVLKRLSQALADGDNILAVIKGSAINNDGSQKVGYTAPSIEGQSEVIAEALAMAGVTAETISYVEAHGTGTPLGDPIEIAALTRAFRVTSDKRQYCAIGSVKSNLGHLDAAAGVGGLIKTVLQLQHKRLVPSLHYDQANPKIDFANSPFYVNTKLQEWKSEGGPRRAGVSSFGIGGTNAHVVLEEAPERAESGESRLCQLLTVSAKTETALETAAANLAVHLEQATSEKLADVAYTQQVGRAAYKHRRAVVCSSKEQGRAGLRGEVGARVWSGAVDKERQLGFLFPGQGAQYVNMGRELYESEEVFRRELERCSEVLRSQLAIDIREVLYPPPTEEQRAAEQLKETKLTQPVLLAVEWALAQQWLSWGLKPEALAGHSIGEYAAATLAGVMEIEEALRIVAARGRVMQAARRGAMLSVPLGEEEVSIYLRDGVWLAAVNGPQSVVVGGADEQIKDLEEKLERERIKGQRLQTSHAFHTGMMEEALAEFAEIMRTTRLRPPKIRYLSNVSGTWVRPEDATSPHYWVEHARRTVQFSESVKELLKEEAVLLEVGPGNVLGTLVRQQASDTVVVGSLPGQREKLGALAAMVGALGRMWVSGVKLDWRAYWGKEKRHRVSLPTYPFERRRYWIDPAEVRSSRAKTSSPAPSTLHKNPNIAEWFYVPSWRQTPPPGLLTSFHTPGSRLRWLLFVDDCGLGSAMRERLRLQEQEVISVSIGEQFGASNGGAYTLREGNADEHAQLIADLTATGQMPNKIVYLWSLTSNGICNTAKLEQRCFYSLLALAQALGDAGLNDRTDVSVVSNQLHNILGDETIVPEKALLLGPSKVMPQEYPNLTCRSIDVALPSGGEHLDCLAEKLISECRAESQDAVVAYRRNTRWVQAFEQVPLPESVLAPRPIRTRGVYLITGGLGGIGLTIAAHLARTAQARLVLISRGSLPERGDWHSWLETHDEQDSCSRRIRKIREIEQAGGEVLAIAADICNENQMRNVLVQAKSRFGAIHGVIHAAGIAGGGLMQIKKQESAARVLAPKVGGTRILAAALSSTELDFIALCSSVTALQGTIGQVDYTAANCFLDAFAQSGRVLNCVSINWEAWQEVGMAVDTNLPHDLQGLRREELKDAILPGEGAHAFESALRGRVPQLIVSPRPFVVVMPAVRKAGVEQPQLKPISEHAGLHPRPPLQVKYTPARNAVDERLIDIWQKLLGIGPIGIHDSFFDLGGHSLLATQVVSRIRESFKVDLPLRQLFEFTTVAGLSDRIATARSQEQELERVLSELERMTDEEAQQLLASEIAKKSSSTSA